MQAVQALDYVRIAQSVDLIALRNIFIRFQLSKNFTDLITV